MRKLARLTLLAAVLGIAAWAAVPGVAEAAEEANAEEVVNAAESADVTEAAEAADGTEAAEAGETEKGGQKEAEAVQRDISVLVDGIPLQFSQKPYAAQGTTMVPFRIVLEKLGMEVGWDPASSKVTGKSEDIEVELTVGSKTAVVNGQEVELPRAPETVKGTTFVPVRFLGEATGREVSWDPYVQEVHIAHAEGQIRRLLAKHILYINQQNMDGLRTTIDPLMADREIASAVEVFKEIEEFRVDLYIDEIQIQGETAYVRGKQVSRTSSVDYPDNRAYVVNLVVQRNGQWKLGPGAVYRIEYFNDHWTEPGPLLLSESDKQAIRELVRLSVQASADEDIEAERSFYMEDYPDLDEAVSTAEYLYSVFNFEYACSEVEFIRGEGDEAVIRYQLATRKTRGPDAFDNSVMDIVEVVKKDSDGRWKFAFTELISVDYREEALEEVFGD